MEESAMPQALIEGAISATAYLHITYGTQVIDGTRYTLYDIVILPKDERGSVAFALPQGITVTIDVYAEMNGPKVMNKVVTIPRCERVALVELLK
jgi:hypothetical protein